MLMKKFQTNRIAVGLMLQASVSVRMKIQFGQKSKQFILSIYFKLILFGKGLRTL